MKNCAVCNAEMVRNVREAHKVWEQRKTCSYTCAGRYRAQNETPEARKQRIANAVAHRDPKSTAWSTGLRGAGTPTWKGHAATYNSKHRWVQKNWVKTGKCEHCGGQPKPRVETRLHVATQWANISNQYRRERTDWLELCVRCHRAFDRSKA